MKCDEDRSIEKAKATMEEVLQPLYQNNAKIRARLESKTNLRDPAKRWVSGEREADGKHEDRPAEKEKSGGREREVNPEAVKESFKEAELDPIAETEPEEGETAA